MEHATDDHEQRSTRQDRTITQELAAFVVSLRPEALPEAVRDRIRLHILDTIGCQLAFAAMPWSRDVARYVDATGSAGPSTMTFTGARVAPELAAFANACAAHGFEMDDTDILTASHPGTVIVPAALALAQQRPTTGAQFATAVFAGYEIMLRIGYGGNGMTARGFHSTAATGPFGSAAAAAVLQGMDAATTAHAFGICASRASGISEYTQTGGSVKRAHAGFGAQAGLQAAALAAAGMTAPTTAIEGTRGLLRALTETPVPAAVTAGLGTDFAAIKTGFKMHCCCAGQHSVLDGVTDLSAEHAFGADDIASITVRQNPREYDAVGITRRPKDVIAAQFSGRFGIALRLRNGSNGFYDYIDATLDDPRLLEIIDKIDYQRVDPATPLEGDGPCELDIVLNDGRRFHRHVRSARGMMHHPLSEDQVVNKFLSLTVPLLGAPRANSIVDMVLGIMQLEDAGTLASELVISERNAPDYSALSSAR